MKTKKGAWLAVVILVIVVAAVCVCLAFRHRSAAEVSPKDMLNEHTVAVVNGVPIDASVMEIYKDHLGELANGFVNDTYIVYALVEDEVYTQDAAENGITVTDEEVADYAEELGISNLYIAKNSLLGKKYEKYLLKQFRNEEGEEMSQSFSDYLTAYKRKLLEAADIVINGDFLNTQSE